MAQVSSDQPSDDKARLKAHFVGDIADPDRWSKLWDKGDCLPLDRGVPNPALVDLLSLTEGLPNKDAVWTHKDNR